MNNNDAWPIDEYLWRHPSWKIMKCNCHPFGGGQRKANVNQMMNTYENICCLKNQLLIFVAFICQPHYFFLDSAGKFNGGTKQKVAQSTTRWRARVFERFKWLSVWITIDLPTRILFKCRIPSFLGSMEATREWQAKTVSLAGKCPLVIDYQHRRVSQTRVAAAASNLTKLNGSKRTAFKPRPVWLGRRRRWVVSLFRLFLHPFVTTFSIVHVRFLPYRSPVAAIPLGTFPFFP